MKASSENMGEFQLGGRKRVVEERIITLRMLEKTIV